MTEQEAIQEITRLKTYGMSFDKALQKALVHYQAEKQPMSVKQLLENIMHQRKAYPVISG